MKTKDKDRQIFTLSKKCEKKRQAMKILFDAISKQRKYRVLLYNTFNELLQFPVSKNMIKKYFLYDMLPKEKKEIPEIMYEAMTEVALKIESDHRETLRKCQIEKDNYKNLFPLIKNFICE